MGMEAEEVEHILVPMRTGYIAAAALMKGKGGLQQPGRATLGLYDSPPARKGPPSVYR